MAKKPAKENKFGRIVNKSKSGERMTSREARTLADSGGSDGGRVYNRGEVVKDNSRREVRRDVQD